MRADWLQPPYSVTDLLACILLVLATIYATLKWRDNERGMGWLAAAMVAFALFIGNNARHLPVDPLHLRGSLWNLSLLAGCAGLFVGVSYYVELGERSRRRYLALMLTPVAACTVLALGVVEEGWQVSRNLYNLLLASAFFVPAVMCFRAAVREGEPGHGYVGAALTAGPVMTVILSASGSPSAALRYWAYLPLIAIGLTLLTISLLRRRRALEAEVARRAQAEQALSSLNVTLEAKVAARTSELQEIILGLETFNRSVSHDLRGPLGGIDGLTRLAIEALQDGDIATAMRMLTVVSTQAATSFRLVESLLSLARGTNKDLVREPVDLDRLAREVSRDLLAAHGDAPARIDIGPLPEVLADRDLMRAVLTNLIGNAIKFTADRKNARVDVSATNDAGEVTVKVNDNGVGFDAVGASKLFQPFSRLHGNRFAGSGVGLTIVRRVVERHGGRVWAAGEPGAGATFAFSMPVSGDREAQPASA